VPRTRPPYPEEFRREAIRLAQLGDKPQRKLAKDLGISGVTLRNWLKDEKASRGERPGGLSSDEREELARLRDENATLRMEREILRRAPVFFASEDGGRKGRSTPHPAITLHGIAYRHLLVVYDGTSEGDEAIVAANRMAHRDRTRLTVVVVVVLEQPVRWVTRWPRGTGVWNDVLLDRARADLERAARLLEVPAELTALFGPSSRAVPAGAKEFDCDAIMLPPRPRQGLARLFSRDRAAAIRRRASCEVLQPR
jgi:transposase